MIGGGVSLRMRSLPRDPILDIFGLCENPFSLTPNPRFLHRTRHAHETLGRLTRGILDRKGLIILSGDIGTGKTTLLYTALHLMDVNPAVHNKIGSAVIVHPTLTREEFLEAVLDEFDVSCSSTLRHRRLEALLNMLLEVRRKSGVAVLVIDEAQLLSTELLDEIRSLLTMQTSHENLLQIVLCGQPEIDAKIDEINLRPGPPLMSLRCKTAPLSLKDTHDYIQHRLRIAGAQDDGIFSPEAADAVHVHAGGVPRLINLLCAQALSAASVQESAHIFPNMIDDAAARICFAALTTTPIRLPIAPADTPAVILSPVTAASSVSAAAKHVTCMSAAAEARIARKQKRAARRRAKMAHAAKITEKNLMQTRKRVLPQNLGPTEGAVRVAWSRSTNRHSLAAVVGAMPAWNEWLNRWCSEHFTSKSCGKPLFQLGLAGTLFLALAQVMSVNFPGQRLPRVAFGFTGMLFIDISLGLGTYLLLLERGLPPWNRTNWAQTLLDSWSTVRRRLG
jgi:general secretion pathway protein A